MSGNSTGQTLGYIVGAVIGYFTGGTSYVFTGAALGGTVGGMLDPPKGPTIVGPRLSDLSVQTSTYGAHIPRIYGTVATFGNVFWLEGDKLKETLTKKKQGGKGGGGSTVKTYSYSATFAVGLCEGPIAGVRRVWVGSKLIYDAGSDDIESIIASNQAAEGFRVYLGTEDQQPDPRMQADKGVNNTPAYRGLAYIVMYDYPLADHGNSLMGAQVKVEVVGDTSGGLPRIVGLQNAIGSSFVSDEATLTSASIVSDGSAFNQRTVRRLLNGAVIEDYTLAVPKIDDHVNTYAIQCKNNPQLLYQRKNASGTSDVSAWFVNGAIGNRPVLPPIGSDSYYSLDGPLYDIGDAVIGVGGNSGAGQRWIARWEKGVDGPESTPSSFYDLWGAGYTSGVGAALYFDGVSIWAHMSSSELIRFSADLVVGDIYSGVPGSSSRQFAVIDSSIFACVTSIDGLGGSDFKLFDIGSWAQIGATLLAPGSSVSNKGDVWPVSEGVVYNNGAIISLTAQVESSTHTLSSIVLAEVQQADIATSDIDVSDLTDEVRGYRVTQTGAIRAAIEPLQSAWPFDVIQSGYKIKAVKRGNASVATIPAELLDARAAGEASGPQITIVREMDNQLPRRVSIKHMDIAREYDIGEQSAERNSGSSISVREMEMPIVFTATEAAQRAEVLLYLYWLERYTIQFKLPPEYLYLEPADVITITASDASYELRLTNINYLSDGRLECVARYNSAAIYTSTVTGEESAVLPGTVGLAGPSKYELLDIPAVHSSMDSPAFVAAMTGYTSAWPGGILFRSTDSGQTWDDIQGWTGKGTMGSARNAIGTQPSTTVDSVSWLRVDLLSGELESVTELAMLNGANHFAYGKDGRWEIIAARTVALQGDGSYVIQDMLRGRFGTEHNTGNHAAGDAVILLNDPDNALISVDSASIGLSRLYRGITAGRAIDSDADRAFTYAGVNLECLSPVYLNGNRHPSTNDWTLTWIRRTRIGGEWRDLVDAPLSEAAEAYEIDIFSSNTYTTLKRALTNSTPTVAYTSAQQVTDFGSNQSTLYVRIYQMSSTVGRGFPLQTSITR